ncbi:helix-turn-helix domain-containing protein [Stenotrophomonas rhizophila]|uniref:helix-turn-helix domain-containing protein n=1 Tax=Stenotrophomonas rhizophila TaxID=216778 RepID=UPI003D1110DC
MSQRFNSHSVAAELGVQVRASRLSRRMTLAALAEAVGVHHSQISRVERGGAITFSPNVQKICKFLNIQGVSSAGVGSRGNLADRVEALRVSIPEGERVLDALLGVLEQIEWPAKGANPSRR